MYFNVFCWKRATSSCQKHELDLAVVSDSTVIIVAWQSGVVICGWNDATLETCDFCAILHDSSVGCLGRNTVPSHGLPLGTGGHTKMDETSEKFQTAFEPPPPHFRKVILRISRQKCVCSLWRDCWVLNDPISNEMHVVQQFNMVIGWKHTLKRPFCIIFMLKSPI